MATEDTAFWDEYEDLAHEVADSTHQLFALNLRRWFDLLDGEPRIARTIRAIEMAIDFVQWYEACRRTVSSMVGSGTLDWPREQRQRLALQIQLFRRFASEELKPTDFATDFLYTGNNFNVMVSNISTQLFIPLSNELRRHLVREVGKQSQIVSSEVPASDRVVRLDDNSAAYQSAHNALEGVERAVRNSNDYPDSEDREQRLAEIGAIRHLLKATRVRVAALMALAVPLFLYLAKTFADSVVGELATKALSTLQELVDAMPSIPF